MTQLAPMYQQQLHLDPLNAVALPILESNQQMLPSGPSQHPQNYASSSMTGTGNYQQSSMVQRNLIANGSGSSRLSTISKHSISHNTASHLHHIPGGKLRVIAVL